MVSKPPKPSKDIPQQEIQKVNDWMVRHDSASTKNLKDIVRGFSQGKKSVSTKTNDMKQNTDDPESKTKPSPK